jgi:hypothetical protein
MKTYNKIIISVLASMSLAGCSCSQISFGHVHTYSNSWSYDEQYHWHVATCEHKSEIKDKEEHTLGNWIIDIEATEYHAGQKHKECNKCDYVLTETIEKLDHTHKPDDAVIENLIEPTCLDYGSYDLVVYCSECSEELSRKHESLEPLGHDVVLHDGKEPTCTEDGWYEYETCTRCNYSTFEKIPATGHLHLAIKEENRIEATCTTDGSYELVTYCTDDGVEVSRETVSIPATGHLHLETKEENRIEATCTVDGSYDLVTYCKDDNVEVSRETILINHSGHKELFDIKKNIVEPTCITDGSYDLVTYCGVCNEKIEEQHVVTNKLGHHLIHHHGKDSTCLEPGYDDYVECDRCDYSTKEFKELLEHCAGEKRIENIVAPTDNEPGSFDLVVMCSVGGEELARDTYSIGNSTNVILTENSASIFEQELYRFYIDDSSPISDVDWMVSDEDLLTINSKGKMASYGAGEFVVLAIADSGEFASAYLKVIEDEIEIEIPSNVYYPGDNFNVIVIKNSRNDSSAIKWTSSDESVAAIDELGRVTVNEKGNVTITAELPSGKNSQVNFAVDSHFLTLNATSKTLYRNDRYTLLNSCSRPSSVIWTSSNTSVASVSSNGVVTANAVGTATITASSSVCGTKTCKITVTSESVTLTKSNYSSYLTYSYTIKRLTSDSIYNTYSISMNIQLKDRWVVTKYVYLQFYIYYGGTWMQEINFSAGISEGKSSNSFTTTQYSASTYSSPSMTLLSVQGTIER